MKKPIHLYIFVVLSAIASLSRLWSTFMSKFDEAMFTDMPAEAGGADFVMVMRATTEFQTNLINRVLAVVLLVLIVTTIVFLVKKQNETASYSYLAYLFGTLISSTYTFIGSKQVVQLYSDANLRSISETTALVVYGMSIVLFLLYAGLTLFFLLRKPKEKASVAQSGMDI